MGDETPELLPFENMSSQMAGDTGVLWAINKALFHPRGFALTIQIEDDGTASGWFLQGDGTECWSMTEEMDDAGFAAFEAFLEAHRPQA